MSFRLPEHEVYKPSAGYAYRCPAWDMTWYFTDKANAEFCLAAHLAYPVAPCAGSQTSANVDVVPEERAPEVTAPSPAGDGGAA